MYLLMYGREARLPSDLMYGTPPDTTDDETSPVDFVARQQDILRRVHTPSFAEILEQRQNNESTRTKGHSSS